MSRFHFRYSKNEINPLAIHQSLSESEDTRNSYSIQLLYSLEIKQISLSLFEFHLILQIFDISIRFVKVIKLQRNDLRILLLERGKL